MRLISGYANLLSKVDERFTFHGRSWWRSMALQPAAGL
jgi:hypothetical protein